MGMGRQALGTIPGYGADPRCYHAMAYDSTRKRMVLFGGELGYDTGVYARDTWELREYSLRS